MLDSVDQYGIPIRTKQGGTDDYGIPIKKKIGTDNVISSSPTVSTPINTLQGLKDAINNVHIEQQPTSNLGVDIGMQTNQFNTQNIKVQAEKTANKAQVNTALKYFKSNPALMQQLAKNNPDLLAEDADGKPIKDEYNYDALQNTSIFNNKVNELKDQYKNGTLQVYQTPQGEDRLSYKASGWNNFLTGLKDAWDAKGKSAGILNMSEDDFIKNTNAELSKDDSYLPVKPNQESNLYALGSALPMVAKGALGSATGAAMATVAPEALEGLPALTAFVATVPEMTDAARANTLVSAYKQAKQQNPSISDHDAYQMATKYANAAGLQGLAQGIAYNFIGGHLPENVGQGLWKATGQWLKNQPTSLLSSGMVGKSTEDLKDLVAQHAGFKMDENSNASDKAMYDAATMQLAFNIGFGLLGTSKYMKSQGMNVLAQADPNEVQHLSEQSVANGWITQEQANQGLQDLQQYQRLRATLPNDLPEDKAAAVTGLLVKNENLEKQKQTQNPITHDDINAEIKANETKAKQILNSSQPLKYETDNLTGERGQNIGGRPTKEETEAQTKEPIEKTDVGTIADNEKEPITVIKPEENKQPNIISNEMVNNADEISANKEEPFTLFGKNITDHAESVLTAKDKETGLSDTPLTNKGEEQSKNLGKLLAPTDINVIEHNGVERTRQTAEEAADEANKIRGINKGTAMEEANGVKAVPNKLLSTLDTGKWTGKENGEFPEEEYFNNPDKVIEGTEGKTTGQWMNQMEQLYGHVKNAPETTHFIASSKVMRALKALDETNGKWTDETTNKFLNNKNEQYATTTGEQSADNIQQHQGTSSGANLPTNTTEVRQGESRQTSGSNSNVGSGESQTKNEGEGEEENVSVQKPPFVLTHRGIQGLATEVGLPDVTPRQRESRLGQMKDAENLVDKWKNEGSYTKNINDLIQRAKEGKIDEVEQFVLANHIATLRNQFDNLGKTKGIHSQEFKDKFDEIDDAKQAAQVMRSKAGGLLGAQSIGIPDNTLEGFLQQEKDLNKGAPLTDNQITNAVNEYEKINAAANEYKQKYEDLQAKYAKLLAEREVKKQSSSTTKNPKKTHEEYVKERKSITDSIKDKLKKARGESQATFVPYANELIAIAPDVAKLAKSFIEEGVSKLEDVVKAIHDDLKGEIPNIQEKDVHDILAGKYNKPQKTRSQVAEQLQNIRYQAKLINKYESLLKGEQPKTEKAKIKWNQEVHDLRNKIEGIQKQIKIDEKEANTFYGESDAGNRRIEKLEDELQRLKERRPKEKTEKQQREISDREKELKDQIAEERKKIKAEEKEANTFYKDDAPSELKRLQAIKKRNEKAFSEIQEELKTGNFKQPEKKVPLSQDDELKKNFPQAYKEAMASQTKLVKARLERQQRMAQQQFEQMSKREKAAKNVVRYLNVPRTLMASWDFSAPLRQAAVSTVAHPLTAARAFKTMFHHAWSQEAFDRFYHDIKESPRWQLYEDSKLALTDPHELHLSKQEEAYLGGNVAEKIPLLGKGVKASERAYVSYLNKMRIDMFDRFADLAEEEGKTFSNSPDLYKGIAKYINNATGRGSLPKSLDAYSPFLNTLFFSPRLIASRINMLNPVFYARLPKEVRVMAAKDMLKFIATGMTALALAKYGLGLDVEDDPRSSDFGKIKDKNTRWDIWGGFQPYARVITQLATGERKTQREGVYEIDKKFGQNRTDVLGSFFRGKLAPIPSLAWDLIGGRTQGGQKIEKRFDIPFYKADNPSVNDIDYTDEAIQHLIPLLGQDIYSAMQDQGVKALFTAGVPSTFGVGVQTYQPYVPKPKPPSKEHYIKTSRQFEKHYR